jgi:hypothetical protein
MLNNYYVLKGAYLNHMDLVTFDSKLYLFSEILDKVRFTIKESGGGYNYFSLSSFEMFDKEGLRINLTTDMITSNADHVVINPEDYGKEGLGIQGLIDHKHDTFFHSAWRNYPDEAHYLEVTLPEGKYDAFSFTISARGKGSHYTSQFPAILEIAPTFSESN